MKKMNLIELAILGSDIRTIAENIATMNPSMCIAERIISGLPEVTPEQCQAYLDHNWSKDTHEYVGHKFNNAFNENCLAIQYKYKRTVYWDHEYVQPADQEVVSYDDFREMYRKYNCRERADETYKYQMVCYYEDSCLIIPEEL